MDYYKDNWEAYWESIVQAGDFAPWDLISSEAVEEDLQLMKPYFKQEIPLLDLGCGSGLESKAFSKYFDQVIGVDVSHAIIDQVNQSPIPPNTLFQQVDILDEQQINDFVAKFGHVNVYMRGVLQQIKAEDRPQFQQHIKLLLGEGNYLYLKEINPDAREYFRKVIFEKKKIPPHIHRVLVQQVTQLVGVSEVDLSSLFPTPDFHIKNVEKAYIELFFEEEDILRVPATVALLRCRKAFLPGPRD